MPEAPPAAAAAPERAVHTITFWRNGFTVDDGPLRRLEDPANAPFLNVRQAKRSCPKHCNQGWLLIRDPVVWRSGTLDRWMWTGV